MQAQAHPLEPFFHQAVRNSYEGKLGLHDPELTGYITRLLCDFSEGGNLYKVIDKTGRPIEDLKGMIEAADPIFGSASSFDAERSVRKCIGDYALFAGSMYSEAKDAERNGNRPSLEELIQAGKESYFIVSQFNLFEYETEAPLFARLSESFEFCLLGLALVHEELGLGKPPALAPKARWSLKRFSGPRLHLLSGRSIAEPESMYPAEFKLTRPPKVGAPTDRPSSVG